MARAARTRRQRKKPPTKKSVRKHGETIILQRKPPQLPEIPTTPVGQLISRGSLETGSIFSIWSLPLSDDETDGPVLTCLIITDHVFFADNANRMRFDQILSLVSLREESTKSKLSRLPLVGSWMKRRLTERRHKKHLQHGKWDKAAEDRVLQSVSERSAISTSTKDDTLKFTLVLCLLNARPDTHIVLANIAGEVNYISLRFLRNAYIEYVGNAEHGSKHHSLWKKLQKQYVLPSPCTIATAIFMNVATKHWNCNFVHLINDARDRGWNCYVQASLGAGLHQVFLNRNDNVLHLFRPDDRESVLNSDQRESVLDSDDAFSTMKLIFLVPEYLRQFLALSELSDAEREALSKQFTSAEEHEAFKYFTRYRIVKHY